MNTLVVTQSAKDNITGYLTNIAIEKNVRILHACETGSRAWGFASPDSDYDVRALYVQDVDWYLQIWDEKDSFECMFEDRDIDISAWELRKSLQLLYKSNVSMLERIQSDILYTHNPDFYNQLRDVAELCYAKIATMYHYLGLAQRCIADIKADEPYKLKRFFYALRSSTCCLWILERDDIPPIHFPTMLTALVADGVITQDIDNQIQRLITLKTQQNETYFHTGEVEVISFITSTLKRAQDNASNLSGSLHKNKAKERLNLLMQSTVKR